MREAGIAAYGLVGEAALRDACRGMPASVLERLGLGDSCGAIVAALPYGEGAGPGATAATAPATTAPGALAAIARFARANWYAELASRQRHAAMRIGRRLHDAGLDPGARLGAAREWRYFVNSAFPEKRLALMAGLGQLGLHGLVMLPTYGSAAVLGLLLVPKRAAWLLSRVDSFAPSAALEARLPSPDCEGCGRCVAACPTGLSAGTEASSGSSASSTGAP